MPRLSALNRQAQAGAVTLVTTAETVVCTLPNVSTDRADALVNLEAVCQVLTGTGATALTLRVRRGIDTTGVLVGLAVAENAAATQTSNLELQVQDAPGEVASQSYVVTVQQAGASGNGTAQQTSLAANF